MTQIVVAQRMWQRRDTAANWTSANPVLAAGEIGVQLGATTADPQRFKIGNGSTPWNTLPFAGEVAGYSVVKTVSADPYNLVLADFNNWIEHQGGNVVLPETAGAGIFVGWHSEIIRSTDTDVTFSGASGSVNIAYDTTLFSAAIRYKGGAVVVKCIAANTYRLAGALADA